MADSHAFEITVHLDALPGLAQSVNACLAPESGPIAAPDLLALAQDKARAEMLLTFVFPTDEALSVLVEEHPDLRVSPTSVALGYVVVSARAHEDLVDVCFFSTSHALAAAMRESGHVRTFFRSLARHAANAEVREVNEWNESRPLQADEEGGLPFAG